MTLQQAMKIVNDAREDYQDYVLQCRESGLHPETFDDWSRDCRQEAEDRWNYHFDNDTQDLY